MRLALQKILSNDSCTSCTFHWSTKRMDYYFQYNIVAPTHKIFLHCSPKLYHLLIYLSKQMWRYMLKICLHSKTSFIHLLYKSFMNSLTMNKTCYFKQDNPLYFMWFNTFKWDTMLLVNIYWLLKTLDIKINFQELLLEETIQNEENVCEMWQRRCHEMITCASLNI